MDRLTANRMTLLVCVLYGFAALVAVFSALPDGIHVSPQPDPTRYCFSVQGAGGQWSCYLKDDIPAGLVPVWVGPESLIPKEGQP